MSGLDKLVTIIFGGVITLAIWSVVVGRNSKAPAVIQAGSSALANIVSAAVSPAATASTNGNLGLNTFTNPAL